MDVSGQPPVLVRLIRAAPPALATALNPDRSPSSSEEAGGAIIMGSNAGCIGDLGDGGVELPLPLRLPPPLLPVEPDRVRAAAAAKTVAFARLASSPLAASSSSSIMFRLMQHPAWRAYEREHQLDGVRDTEGGV